MASEISDTLQTHIDRIGRAADPSTPQREKES
jgi:hypothetical protein